MTKEERQALMMAKWETVKSKFPGVTLGTEAFTAFLDGFTAGHEIGCNETAEIAIDKVKAALSGGVL